MAILKTPNIVGPIFDQDSTEFFFARPPSEMNVKSIHDYIDRLARVCIGTFVSNCNAMKANFANTVWETDWDGYDPAGPDDQPVLRYLPAASIPATRNRLEAAKRLADQGINFHATAFERCRHHGMGAWLSVRMNDIHACMDPESSLLSTFFKEQRAAGKLRAQHRDRFWMDRALDWERPEVQEHYFRFVRMLLETFDLDGIMLDWMRFVVHFRPGRELVGGRVITAWMQRVKAECARAAARLGHPVRIGVRVPSSPETARRVGLDGVAWARAGLVDLLVTTPFWATADFDIPVAEWRRLLGDLPVCFAAGAEVRYQPALNGSVQMIPAAHLRGLCTTMLHGGADAVYLFNLFPTGESMDSQWGAAEYDATIAVLRELAVVAATTRTHAITYRDNRAPGEPDGNVLPATDNKCDQPSPPGFAFRMQTGPKPEPARAVRLEVEWAAPVPSATVVRAYVNSRQVKLSTAAGAIWTYEVPTPWLEEEAQVIEFETPGRDTIVRLELHIAAKA